jgi:hypothetical protein
MDEFDLQLEQAVARGQRERKLKTTRAADKAMTEEELRRLHNEYRLELSEYIDRCLSRLPKYLPGFVCQTVVDDRGWGSSCSRDDAGIGSDKTRTNFFSRLEVVVRPYGSHHVLDIAAKGTVRNKEIYNRHHFRPLAEVDLEDFKGFVDLWVPQYAEKFAAS